ncbi:MAG: hypothetical protein Q9170_008243, partial [Blastenia crenularia]
MSTAGPEIPPHLLAKRKRLQEAEEPNPEPSSHSRSSSTSSSSNADDAKRRRTIGPAPPPAPLSEKPSEAPALSDSDSDDDFGPSLPPLTNPSAPQHETRHHEQHIPAQAPPKPQREEWMLIPPSQDNWSSRIDPTKLRNRKFNSGKGAKAAPSSRKGGGEISALWTETPEEKRRRLEDEMLGVKKPAQLVEDDDGG